MTVDDRPIRRVVFVLAKRTTGGTAQLALQWARCLRDVGVEVAVVSLTDQASSRPDAPAIAELEQEIGPVEGLGHTGGRALVRTSLRLRRVLRRFDADVVHAFLPLAENAARLATLGLAIPVVGTLVSTGSLPDTLPHRVRRALRRHAPGLLVDRWIAVGETVRARLAEHDLPPRRVVVVHPAMDLARTRCLASSPGALPPEEGKGGPTLITVGRIIPSKGHATLIRAREHLPEWDLWIVGRGAHRPRLEELAREVGVADRVRWLGERDDVPSLLARADVYVAASTVEGLAGYATLEAAALGRPMVVSAIPEVEEVLAGTAARLVDPLDPTAYARAIREVGGRWSVEEAASLRDRMDVTFDGARIAAGLLSAYDIR
jgi:glycosyltransferase involved in cell wall biosynthesis